MESRPPQDPPRRVPGRAASPGRAGNGSPTPALDVGLPDRRLRRLIIWMNRSGEERDDVPYSPWFIDQVRRRQRRVGLDPETNQVRGELRVKRPSPARQVVRVQADQALLPPIFPRMTSIDPDHRPPPRREKLADGRPRQRIRIETNAMRDQSGLVWMLMLLPTLLIVILIYL